MRGLLAALLLTVCLSLPSGAQECHTPGGGGANPAGAAPGLVVDGKDKDATDDPRYREGKPTDAKNGQPRPSTSDRRSYKDVPPQGPSNCHGYALGEGKHVISGDGENSDLKKILDKDYKAVERNQAKVGDIVVYDYPDAPSHTALVVEVNPDGTVRTCVGKQSEKDGVIIHSPADAFGERTDSYTVLERKEVPADRQQAVADKKAEMEKATGDAKIKAAVEYGQVLNGGH